MKYYNTLLTERIGYDFYCDIAERMVEARKKKGWTQADLAKASGIKLSRISEMESVHIRSQLPDVEKLAKILDVSVDWLIDAQLDCHGEDGLYLVWRDGDSGNCLKLYEKASSARMAFLKIYQRVHVGWGLLWFGPRDRAIVKLVGVPIKKAELAAKFPKRTADDDPIAPDQEGGQAS